MANPQQEMAMQACGHVAHEAENIQNTESVYIGFGRRGLLAKGSFEKKVHFLEILEILEILESPQTVENKGESDHCLEILENLDILENLEIPGTKKEPLSYQPLCLVPITDCQECLAVPFSTQTLPTEIKFWGN